MLLRNILNDYHRYPMLTHTYAGTFVAIAQTMPSDPAPYPTPGDKLRYKYVYTTPYIKFSPQKRHIANSPISLNNILNLSSQYQKSRFAIFRLPG